jgi:hypothetical protein
MPHFRPDSGGGLPLGGSICVFKELKNGLGTASQTVSGDSHSSALP